MKRDLKDYLNGQRQTLEVKKNDIEEKLGLLATSAIDDTGLSADMKEFVAKETGKLGKALQEVKKELQNLPVLAAVEDEGVAVGQVDAGSASLAESSVGFFSGSQLSEHDTVKLFVETVNRACMDCYLNDPGTECNKIRRAVEIYTEQCKAYAKEKVGYDENYVDVYGQPHQPDSADLDYINGREKEVHTMRLSLVRFEDRLHEVIAEAETRHAGFSIAVSLPVVQSLVTAYNIEQEAARRQSQSLSLG